MANRFRLFWIGLEVAMKDLTLPRHYNLNELFKKARTGTKVEEEVGMLFEAGEL